MSLYRLSITYECRDADCLRTMHTSLAEALGVYLNLLNVWLVRLRLANVGGMEKLCSELAA